MLKQLFDLTGRVALVTGASRGFGMEIAKLFAEAGALVVLNGRHAETLQTAADVVRRHGLAEIAAFDVADIPAGLAAIEAITKTHGSLDILVNNAGMNIRKPLADYALEDWRQVLEVDLTAPFALAQAASLGMAKRGYGRIINIASLSSFVALYEVAAYAASKAALETMVKSYSEELSLSNVKANVFWPGAVRTQMRAKAFPGEDPDTLPQPKDVAPALTDMIMPEFTQTRVIYDFERKATAPL